ncbi:class I SAM-dependent methyltransferase [Ensifer sesbaniae]|uniref:class I SAM-dependent methyltransferase n=1 Tax=Ensifer sesbaniae TaxID=1214071 RepID=UPI0020006822|nr:class I SAM-dependent methyltransferase [Ensifer sesbaniae]
MPNTKLLHPPHRGQSYQEVLTQLSKARTIERYLEIGVRGGKTFANVHCDVAIGVDPQYLLNSNIMLNKKMAFLFQMTSDVFFRSIDSKKYLGGSPDLAFLDGMHKFEYLLRDFMHVESVCERHSLIAMHDCLPLNEAMANRNESTAKALSAGTNYENWWTGDVWKLLPILKKYRPDLKLIAVDAPPTGLVFITNLNPNSRLLNEEYMNIITEFAPGSIWDEKLTSLYEITDVMSTDSLLNESEQSLYFRM